MNKNLKKYPTEMFNIHLYKIGIKLTVYISLISRIKDFKFFDYTILKETRKET